MRVASYLILERDFPRSIRYGVMMAHCSDRGDPLRGQSAGHRSCRANPWPAECAARICRAGGNLQRRIASYLQKIQDSIAETAVAVQKSYFLH